MFQWANGLASSGPYDRSAESDAYDIAPPNSYAEIESTPFHQDFSPESHFSPKSSVTNDIAQSVSPSNSARGRDLFLRVSHSSSKAEEVKKCSWNNKFQTALDVVKNIDKNPSLTYHEREKIWHNLAAISKDFAYCAKSYGRIIISEVALSEEEKHIRPVPTEGQAGGEKFIVNSILFKFAIDNNKIYGGNEEATWKMAGQEILCLNAYSHLVVGSRIDNNISFPLCCLVDYRGFRLVAISIIPREEKSLRYGTSDGGQTVFNDSTVTDIMDEVGKQLNLAKHYVCRKARGPLSAEQLSSCADLELHEGADGRYYLIDFSRAMPPQDVNVSGDPHAHLINKLRPEFVKQYEKPLNPDAFSRFIQFPQMTPTQMDFLTNQERDLLKSVQAQDSASRELLVEATKHLIDTTVPSIAQSLTQFAEKLNKTERTILFEQWMPVLIHFFGVNMRWIGLIRKSVPEGPGPAALLRHHLLVEAIARVIKIEIRFKMRALMRELKSSIGEQPFIKCIVDYLNLVFGKSAKSQHYWRSEIATSVAQKFKKIVAKEDRPHLRQKLEAVKDGEVNGLCSLFDRVQKIAGLKFRKPVKQRCLTQASRFEVRKPFLNTDILSLDEVIKCNHIIAHSQGTVLQMTASSTLNDNKNTHYFKSLFKEALIEFRSSLQAIPRSATTLCTTAGVYNNLEHTNLAELFYNLAIEADPKNAEAQLRFGKFLEQKKGDRVEAEKRYCTAYNLHKNPRTMLAYAVALRDSEQTEKAQAVFEESLAKYPEDSRCHHTYALFLEKNQDTTKADLHYLKALQLNNTNQQFIEDYATFLRDVIFDIDASNQYFDALNKLKQKAHVNLQESIRFGAGRNLTR